MAREISKGKCVYCDRELSKSAITNHLKSCKQRAAGAQTVSTKKSRKTKLLHLVVEGQYLRMYWMHLEVPTTITLADLDSFLRDIWLECCGHLSAFSIDGISYKFHLDPEYDDAMAYMNLLVRERADLLDAAAEYAKEIDAADKWVQKALATKKKAESPR